MEITRLLTDTENALRDFIQVVLSERFGAHWPQQCGLAPDRLRQWQSRRVAEALESRSGTVNEDLVHYADFSDLRTLLDRNWQPVFSTAFGDKKEFESLLEILERYRHRDAEQVCLLPYEQHLVLGISGSIRVHIAAYRSNHDTQRGCFPHLERIWDNYGNLFTPNHPGVTVHTTTVLRPGDRLSFVVVAEDPEEVPLEYGLSTQEYRINRLVDWQSGNRISYEIEEKDVQSQKGFRIEMRSNRHYHAWGDFDQCVWFYYQVLPG